MIDNLVKDLDEVRDYVDAKLSEIREKHQVEPDGISVMRGRGIHSIGFLINIDAIRNATPQTVFDTYDQQGNKLK